jgi:hypothetical protein
VPEELVDALVPTVPEDELPPMDEIAPELEELLEDALELEAEDAAVLAAALDDEVELEEVPLEAAVEVEVEVEVEVVALEWVPLEPAPDELAPGVPELLAVDDAAVEALPLAAVDELPVPVPAQAPRATQSNGRVKRMRAPAIVVQRNAPSPDFGRTSTRTTSLPLGQLPNLR